LFVYRYDVGRYCTAVFLMSHRHLTRDGLIKSTAASRPICNHKIVSNTKNLQSQIWRSDHAIKGDQLCSSTRQLGPVLYLLYTATFSLAPSTTTTTCADDTAILAHNNHIQASLRLQESLFYIQKWLKKWRIRVNGAKSVQAIFITRRGTCLPVTLNSPLNSSSRRH